MGRKSLANERRDQILDAFERCVVRNGLDGVTIEQIAAEAGVMPSIIRHYIGNWDNLVRELVIRVIKRFDRMIDEIHTVRSDRDIVPTMLGNMFPGQREEADNERFIVGILMTSKDRYPEMKEMILNLLEKAVNTMGRSLNVRYPGASIEKCNEIAYSVICMSIANDIAVNLGSDPRYIEGARRSAETLINELESC